MLHATLINSIAICESYELTCGVVFAQELARKLHKSEVQRQGGDRGGGTKTRSSWKEADRRKEQKKGKSKAKGKKEKRKERSTSRRERDVSMDSFCSSDSRDKRRGRSRSRSSRGKRRSGGKDKRTSAAGRYDL